MKTFYTERDIVDMHAAGVTEIKMDDDVVLTDLAREKALALGVNLKPAGNSDAKQAGRIPRAPGAAVPAQAAGNAGGGSAALPAPPPPQTSPELVSLVKAGVIAKLGTSDYNNILDQVIPKFSPG